MHREDLLPERASSCEERSGTVEMQKNMTEMRCGHDGERKKGVGRRGGVAGRKEKRQNEVKGRGACA